MMRVEKAKQMLSAAAEYASNNSQLVVNVVHDSAYHHFIIEVCDKDSPNAGLSKQQVVGYLYTTEGEYKVVFFWREGVKIPETREEKLESPLFPIYWLFGVIE